jgi:hypothetical protein
MKTASLIFQWTCPQCGHSFRVPAYPVRCACGHVDRGSNADREPSLGTEARPRSWGPGSELRKILGCSAKTWPYYRELNRLSPLGENHISEFAASLVACGHVASHRVAERLIRRAIDQSAAKHSRLQ